MATPQNLTIWYRIGIRRYLIFPSTQIKYAVVLTSISVMGLLALVILQEFFLDDTLFNITDDIAAGDLKAKLRTINFGIIIFSTLLTSFATILVTHRFMGPILAIQRSIDNYNKTGDISKINIRSHDELKPLVESLNKFFDKLKSRS